MLVPVFRVYPLGITYAVSYGVFFFAIFYLDSYTFVDGIGQGFTPTQPLDGIGEFPAFWESTVKGVGNLFFLVGFYP